MRLIVNKLSVAEWLIKIDQTDQLENRILPKLLCVVTKMAVCIMIFFV